MRHMQATWGPPPHIWFLRWAKRTFFPPSLPASLPPGPCCSYEEGANISDAEVLMEVGRQLGLPEQELQSALG